MTKRNWNRKIYENLADVLFKEIETGGGPLTVNPHALLSDREYKTLRSSVLHIHNKLMLLAAKPSKCRAM